MIRIARRSLSWLAVSIWAAHPLSALAGGGSDVAKQIAAIRAADLELATIGYRLATGNAGLCQLKQAQFGMPLQAITQYDRGARAGLGFEAVIAVEAVVPGSPAEQAGLRAGDSLVAIDGVPQPALAEAGAAVGVADRDLAQAALSRGGPSRARVLRVLRGGVARDVAITPRPGCRAAPEVLVGTGLAAQSDGVRLQIGDGYLDRFDADTVALIVAHEMAHNILHHYDQLRRAKSCLAGPEETRRTEDEADRLSVALLANGGYDTALPARFWRGRGAGLQLFSLSRDHGTAGERAKSVEAAAASLRRSSRGVYYPADFQQMLDSTRRPGCVKVRIDKNAVPHVMSAS